MIADEPVCASPSVIDVEPSPGSAGPCLVWNLPAVMRGISSSIVGGGIGDVSWVINLTVDADYARLDPDQHLLQVAHRLHLQGRGIAMMTAVDVSNYRSAEVDGATVAATVGVKRPVWAADLSDRVEPRIHSDDRPGTINLIVMVPVHLSDAALVNVVSTVTEAKVQALLDHGIRGTGTASDAVGVLCVSHGTPEQFGGPRSTWGARIARAVYDATAAGIAAQQRGS